MARRNIHHQTPPQQDQGYARSSGSGAAISFTNGIMHVMGFPQVPAEAVHWGSSNGTTIYTTTKWRDPNTGELRTSCNCPGWAFAKSGLRTCCHTQDMEGTAVCRKQRIDNVVIRTIAEARTAIPDITDGRALRSIMID